MPHDETKSFNAQPAASGSGAAAPSNPLDAALDTMREQARLEGTAANDRTAAPRRTLVQCVFCTVSNLFRPGRRTSLVDSWLPALDGVVEKLRRGARVADVGCSHGHGALIMAEAFPRSEFVGFDDDAAAIDIARRHAARHAVTNLRFRVGYPRVGGRFDLVTCFDRFHDASAPHRVAMQMREALSDGGTWMIVRPGFLAEHPTTGDLPAEDDDPLADSLDETELRACIAEAGFTQVRRAAETPFHTILEARP